MFCAFSLVQMNAAICCWSYFTLYTNNTAQMIFIDNIALQHFIAKYIFK